MISHTVAARKCTPLRGEQQATFNERLRCEEETLGKRKRRIFKRRGMEKLPLKICSGEQECKNEARRKRR